MDYCIYIFKKVYFVAMWIDIHKIVTLGGINVLIFLSKYLKASLMYSINIYLPSAPVKQVWLILDHSLL